MKSAAMDTEEGTMQILEHVLNHSAVINLFLMLTKVFCKSSISWEHNIEMTYLINNKNYSPTCTEAEWSSWSKWTLCSKNCNGGVRYRSRKCVVKNRDNTLTEVGCHVCTGECIESRPCFINVSCGKSLNTVFVVNFSPWWFKAKELPLWELLLAMHLLSMAMLLLCMWILNS